MIDHYTHFDSFGAFIDNAEKRINGIGWVDGSVRERRNPVQFSGTETLQSAIDLARSGWKEGADKLQELSADHVDLDGYELQRDTVKTYDVAGHYPDVAAFCAGEPENMIVEDTPSETMQPVIKLLISGAVGYKTSTQAIERQGAAVLSVVRALQTRGFGVDLSWAIRTYTPKTKFNSALSVNICNADEPLDTESLAFALVHPAMLRRLTFATWELDNGYEKMNASFGQPQHDVDRIPGYANAITLAFTNKPPSMDELINQYLTQVQTALNQ